MLGHTFLKIFLWAPNEVTSERKCNVAIFSKYILWVSNEDTIKRRCFVISFSKYILHVPNEDTSERCFPKFPKIYFIDKGDIN